MKNLIKLSALLIAMIIGWACEEDIFPELEQADPQIVIDAWINNYPEPQYIIISETLPYFDSISNSGIEDATVYVIDNESNTKFNFADKSNGIYEWKPSPEQPQIGIIQNSYSLVVEIGGQVYTSSSVLNRVPEIDSIRFSYKDESLFPEGYYAQFYARDMVGPGDTYWIKTFKNGSFLNKPNEINIAYDAGYTAGGNVDGTLFLEFIRDMINPYDTDEEGEELPPWVPGDSVMVELHSINTEAFTYLTELRLHTDRPGGFAELFAVPLANLPTNIVCTDPDVSKPLGFFNVSAVSRMGEWLDPSNLPGSGN